MARDEGWLAEHMLILKMTSPEGESQVHRGRVPERLRQDQPVDDDPDAAGLEGRDDRRRHRLDEVRQGRQAVRRQPRGGLLRRRAGDEQEDEPERAEMLEHDVVFTNCAKTDDGDIWWEGMTASRPRTPSTGAATSGRRTRTRRRRTRTRASPCAIAQCPSIDPQWDDPGGVPIDAMLFGGRRAHRRAARLRGARLGARRVPRLDDVLGEDRRGHRQRRRAALRPDGDAPVLRLQHGRLLPALAGHRPRARAPSCRGSSTSTGSARTTTASSCGPASGRTPASLAWIFRRLEGKARGERDRDRAGPAGRRGRHRHLRARHRSPRRSRSCSRSTTTPGSSSSRRCTSTTGSSATGCPTSCARSSRRSSAGWAPSPAGLFVASHRGRVP